MMACPSKRCAFFLLLFREESETTISGRLLLRVNCNIIQVLQVLPCSGSGFWQMACTCFFLFFLHVAVPVCPECTLVGAKPSEWLVIKILSSIPERWTMLQHTSIAWKGFSFTIQLNSLALVSPMLTHQYYCNIIKIKQLTYRTLLEKTAISALQVFMEFPEKIFLHLPNIPAPGLFRV